ncbi:DUF5339 family protein [Achromobacter xylosoxidans]|jgi:hypothetical protein|uniref:DUF5339 family protein n=9 Tax=Alcaligenes xylosoxydans xylosoxydans TaxID=85698 RepID=A0A1R1JWW7_ALCXX|nr:MULTISPECIES: DUF5339 family protein [Achromobacter]AHC46547.1 hypothetical protein AX27061_2084 [Achromobacter xylosoxidans NBRC 15126 = ATCC 27061]AXA76763.1 glutaconyl-CoA decarboxylase subunit gamma [Achromobacter xylosoxidans]KAA5924328.1 glutaconyl-CoA decarboxylase subunit gamma [Achromobacter xylosoxidans]KOQ20926.1 glutaconyl-CoA decarboxylase subunit gamma [Achromobacter xylosoxidans]KOQ22773.1 glutaconyl-CoA decarboxylase subunit gamma [Achromobacter xylosoxidans]
MMNTQRKTFAVLALAAALAALAGCNKSDEKAAPPAASTTPAPSTTTPGTPPAATTPPATTAPSGSGAPAGATAGLPAECDAYLTQVSACMDKLGASNPAAASFKQQLDAAKTQWATISDKTQLASQCKQSADLFAQSASQMGCK